MKLRLLRLFCILALFAEVGLAQTTVTGTVTDSDSIHWISSPVSYSLYNPFPNTPPKINGVLMTPSQLNVVGTTDASGAFSLSVTPNASITPTKTQWIIKLCPPINSQCQILPAETVAGSSQSDTAFIVAHIKAPRISINTFNVRAYGDVEIQPTPNQGATYFNVTTAQTRVWNGTAWANIGGTPTASNPTLLFESTITASTEIDVINRNALGQSGAIFQADYDQYQCFTTNWWPSAASAYHVIQFSTNGGSTWDTAADAGWSQVWAQTGTVVSPATQAAVTAGIPLFVSADLTTGPNTTGAPPLSMSFTIYNPLNTTPLIAITDQGTTSASNANNYSFSGGGYINAAGPHNAFRVLQVRGGTTQGTLRCYGWPK
jgi:hypothetical protein